MAKKEWLMKFNSKSLLGGVIGMFAGALIAIPFLIGGSIAAGDARNMATQCAQQSHAYEQATTYTANAASAYADGDYTAAMTGVDQAGVWINKAKAIECKP